jgi:hypothetical protein
MVFLGVLGEYVGRTHTAVGGKRPQATVRAVIRDGMGDQPLDVLQHDDQATVRAVIRGGGG